MHAVIMEIDDHGRRHAILAVTAPGFPSQAGSSAAVWVTAPRRGAFTHALARILG